MTWTRMVVRRYDRKKNKVVATQQLQGWSDTCYVDCAFSIPSSATTEVQLATKHTALTSRKKYWKAKRLRLVVNRTYVDAVVAGTSSNVNTFVAPKGVFEGEEYAMLWIEHANNHPDDPSLQHLKRTLLKVCDDLFKHTFTSTLLAEYNLDDVEADMLAKLLDIEDDNDVTISPAKLARTWLRRPYTPYLQSLPLATRTKIPHLCFVDDENGVQRISEGDPNERVRYVAHTIMERHETGGDTYMNQTDMLALLKSEAGLADVSVATLVYDDHYQPLPKNKAKYVRRQTLAVTANGHIQHLDVQEAEVGLMRIWTSGMDDKREPPPLATVAMMNKEQQEAFANVYRYPISCITGGPGRGKSWLSREICKAWQHDDGGAVMIVSAYHQPLKNLQQSCKNLRPAYGFRTIASVEHDAKKKHILCQCGSSSTKPHQPALLIVEEAGVCTVLDLYSIMNKATSCPKHPTTIVMLGDDKQLKPIGAGQPFADFIKLYPERVVRLVQNMRTDSTNIQKNVAAICDGKWEEVHEGPDFEWRHDVPKDLTHGFYDKYLSEFDLDRDVVIVHKNETRAILNSIIHDRHLDKLTAQKVINGTRAKAAKNTVSTSKARFVPGTRVICVRTDENVTNGTRATVRKNEGRSTVVVKCDDDDAVRTVNPKLFDLAYCITAHKAQGSEYDSPYVYSFDDRYVARDWLYTAVSRAKKKVVYLVPKNQHFQAVHVRPIKESRSLLRRQQCLDCPAAPIVGGLRCESCHKDFLEDRRIAQCSHAMFNYS